MTGRKFEEEKKKLEFSGGGGSSVKITLTETQSDDRNQWGEKTKLILSNIAHAILSFSRQLTSPPNSSFKTSQLL